jgi:hypothetical protein
MADSKNPPVLPEGYDPELAKANRGFAALEKERAAEQAKLDVQDQKAKGGSIKSSASKRADGCAIRGKTRA